jgi:hypothetical protein
VSLLDRLLGRRSSEVELVATTVAGDVGVEGGELVPVGRISDVMPIRRGGRRFRVVPRPRPVVPDQETHAPLHGRDTTMAEVVRLLTERTEGGRHGPIVELFGPLDIGKTTLAEHLVARGEGIYDDGVVLVDRTGRSLRELCSGVFEAFYNVEPPLRGYAPDDLEDQLKTLRALVVIDHADGPIDDLRTLRRILAPSRVLVIAERWPDVGGAVPVLMPQLDLEDALRVLQDVLGDDAPEASGPNAQRLCEALGGYPGRLRQVAMLLRYGDPGDLIRRLGELEVPDATLAEANWQRFNPQQRAIVALLAFLGHASLSAESVAAVTGIADSATILQQLEAEGQVRRHSPTYSLASSTPRVFLDRMDEPVTTLHERALKGFASWATQPHPDRLHELLAQLDAAVALLDGAAERAPEAGLQLVRALDRALLPTVRWDTWERLLWEGIRCAERLTDRERDLAFIRHQLGVLALARGDAAKATGLLEAALATRRKLAEHSATARTQRSLSHAQAVARVNSAQRAISERVPKEGINLGGVLRAAGGAAAGALAGWRLLGRGKQRWRLVRALAGAAAATLAAYLRGPKE